MTCVILKDRGHAKTGLQDPDPYLLMQLAPANFNIMNKIIKLEKAPKELLAANYQPIRGNKKQWIELLHIKSKDIDRYLANPEIVRIMLDVENQVFDEDMHIESQLAKINFIKYVIHKDDLLLIYAEAKANYEKHRDIYNNILKKYDPTRKPAK